MKVSWTQAIGSALGAVSSALLLSTLGVAGTLIGAALGSLVITIGGALYSRSLQMTRDRVLRTAERARSSRGGPSGGPDDLSRETDAPASPAAAEDAPTAMPREQGIRTLPWKRILGAGTAIFVVAMTLILAFELTTGRPVSSYTGGSTTESGTSIPGFDGLTGPGTGEQEESPQDPQDVTPLDPQQEGSLRDDTDEGSVTPGVPGPQQDEAPQDPGPQDDAPQQEAPGEVPPAPQQQDDPE
ncbi:hypothetical protein E8P82_03755 [Arthrobacter echini]|uniref:Uncharacterized protein n=1 Tax=Arthrobacter echini TaxID=1529066 RepID=A0A4V3Z640_9MICC|nr:hypothetical protein [Arthrobacter echini]THJ67949.1 hypothetical protein E8P82_03755 [Arthrobacter echini]